VTLDSTFLRKVNEAVSARELHVKAFQCFDAALLVEDTVAWTKMVQVWERDVNKPNPFAPTLQRISENDVRLELAQEEEAGLREVLTSNIHEDVPPSRLIAQGLELEDLQCLLRSDTKSLGPHSTSL